MNDELIAALEAAHKALRWQWQATASTEHRSNAALIRAHIDSLRGGGPLRLAHDWGFDGGVASERAAIVAWLRYVNTGLEVATKYLADAIEAGEHAT